jgi:ring-1,2-phenylacetyl-CoA epoxidase subunit PaaB
MGAPSFEITQDKLRYSFGLINRMTIPPALNSLDPRVHRLPITGEPGPLVPLAPLDQFGTFEVFVQPKDGKPFQHEGIVHAPNLKMAYVLAKETFTRRFTCISMYVVETRNVMVSPMSEGDMNAYDLIDEESVSYNVGEKTRYEIYHLMKRGKQQVHVGSVEASHPQEAFVEAKQMLNSEKAVHNIWAIRTRDIQFTSPEEKDLWLTLPEKKFRDAMEYRGGEKLKQFLEDRKRHPRYE